MQKALLIIIGIVVCLGLVIGLGILFLGRPSQPAQSSSGSDTGAYLNGQTTGSNNSGSVTTTPPPSTTSTPTGGNPTIPLATTDGGTVVANDITQDPAAGKYSSSGYYYLGYHTPDSEATDTAATENPPYLISYIGSSQYFIIELLEEPLADTRTQAEQYLMVHLGVSQTDMCRLKYMVSVPNSVNPIYAGTNLGFSFCPGAVQL